MEDAPRHIVNRIHGAGAGWFGGRELKSPYLLCGVRLFGDARCSKDQPISSFHRGGDLGALSSYVGPNISKRMVAQIR